MFRKLLKYEWRANARLFLILSLAVLGVAMLGGGILWGANYVVDTTENASVIALVVPGMYLMFGFCLMVLLMYPAAVEIINLVRFYKNKFTDQGYLTFTLPVKTSHIYLSTALNMLLWLLISSAVMFAGLMLMLSIGMSDVLGELWEQADFQYIWSMLEVGVQEWYHEISSVPGYGLYLVLTCAVIAISPLYGISMIMGCMTVGSVLARKHKILASIGIYYGATMVYSAITSTLTSIITLTALETETFYVGYNAVYICQILLMVGITVGSYFLSTHLMKNKLNLP